jgi:DNA-binding NarL/FixJ family response regulator
MIKTRVLLVDDHAVVRGGLRLLIDSQTDMEVVGEADNGQKGLELIRELQPDVAVVDINMPVLNGIDLVRELQKEDCRTQLLILTAHEERAYITQLLRAGAVRFLLKRSAVDQLIQAVRAAATGGQYLDTNVLQALSADEGAAPARPVPDVAVLSQREREVLEFIARGYSNKEIAARLDLSVKTVETYKARSMDKLGLQGRASLVRFAMEQGWLDTPQA